MNTLSKIIRRDIAFNRFPLKHALDAAAISRIMIKGDIYEGRPLSLGRRLDCLKFYFDGGGATRLHAMLPRTGSHWSEIGLAVAINLAGGGDGEYRFIDDLYVPNDGIHLRRLDWRVPMGRTEEMYLSQIGPGSVGTHHYFHTRHPYFRVRCAAMKRMRIVVLARSIVVSLAARFLKHARDPEQPTLISDDENVMEWDRFLTQSIEFYNSWGDVLTWHPRIRLYRYEDLVKDPVPGHKEILDFWGFDVPESCVAEAFARVTPEEMARRMPAELRDGNYRLPTPVDDPACFMPEHRKRWILERLQRELVYDFGYDYSADTQFDIRSI